MSQAARITASAPSTDKPSRDRIDHANLDRRRRRGVHPRSEAAGPARSAAPTAARGDSSSRSRRGNSERAG
jgi:hypothetical protein